MRHLHELSGAGKLERLRVGHLVHRRHHHPAGMLAHAQPVLPRRQPGGLHPVELAPQLYLGERDVAIPLLEFRGGEKPAQIEIAGPVAKPAAHLHERVVHPRSAQSPPALATETMPRRSQDMPISDEPLRMPLLVLFSVREKSAA